MGIEPKEKDYLVDESDMLDETRMALRIYSQLSERWEGSAGAYLGKDLNIVPYLFDLYGIEKEQQKYTLTIMQYMDAEMSKSISKKQKAASKAN